MYFGPLTEDTETANALRGIYPILNITLKTDTDALLDWALKLPDAGIRMVQLRAKLVGDNVITGVLDELINSLRGAGLLVIINDYVELVGITGADGVHLGLDDFPVFEARHMLGRKAIIGATCRNFSEALMAIGFGATYVAVGSVYASPSKIGIPVLGIEGLELAVDKIKEESPARPGWGRYDLTPVVAIGGIKKDRLPEIFAAGASMAAVISAIQDADDPLKAAGKLVKKWRKLSGEK